LVSECRGKPPTALLRPYEQIRFLLQVHTTFSNFDRVLAHFDARKEQVVETTVLVKNLREHFDDIARLHAEYFGAHRPTSTLIGVADLALPPQLVEIAGVALLDESTRTP
jgi:2-iminobutanoate/2-iminopropanoate deaminase